jgi:hypothetical protein
VSTQAFSLTAPVLALENPLLLEQVAPNGSVARVFAHRTEFCEHPRSASHPAILEGSVVSLADAGDEQPPTYQGKWVRLDAVPQEEELTTLAAYLAQQGAIGLLAPITATAEGYLVKRIQARATVALPMLSVRADLLASLIGSRLRARIPIVAQQPQGYNVLASLDGTEVRLANAPVVIGAHYDALGDDVGGLHFPGATDNAAAVAVILEVGRLLASHRTRPRRPVLLVAFDAEEVGIQGSRALASELQAQGKEPIMFNLDGAACLNEAVWVEPGAQTEVLLQALDQAGRWFNIPLIVGNIASDQRAFSQAGFPAVGLSVGCAKIHTPADALHLVEPEALHQAAMLLLGTLWQLLW